jgi:ArsR family transcriptional regulator, arsenate/arsenite/antimonite-responsive transcriptional repressor
MKKQDAVAILAALAQDNRLDVFRLLVEAGPDGMPAGHIGASLRLPPNALTFHLDRLREAGLVTSRRDGRSMIYAAKFEAMNSLVSYLTDHCCQGRPELCKPKSDKSDKGTKIGKGARRIAAACT